MTDKQTTAELALTVSRSCSWQGEDICEVFLEALTDANFHTLRGLLESYIKDYFENEALAYQRGRA